MGRLGIKVWVYKGEVLPEPKLEEAEEVGAIETPVQEIVAESSVVEPVADAVDSEAESDSSEKEE
jgi:ribosomal protein S3